METKDNKKEESSNDFYTLLGNVKPNNESIKIKFKKSDDELEYIDLLSDTCDNNDDEDCIQYFIDETKYLIEIFSEIKKLKNGIYIIEYNLISGTTVSDFGREYFTDYKLISINVA